MKRLCMTAAMVLLLVSCVTVNIYFPAAAAQKAADVIVDEIQGTTKKPEPLLPPDAPKPRQESRLYEFIKSVSFGPAAAHAAEPDLKISTPAIRALKDVLKERFQQIKPFFDKSAVGHTNNGYLSLRDVAALSLKEKADVNRMVEQQNKDRRALYEEIIRANNLNSSDLPKVEKAFANSWRDRAQQGWWIQDDAGAWKKK